VVPHPSKPERRAVFFGIVGFPVLPKNIPVTEVTMPNKPKSKELQMVGILKISNWLPPLKVNG
jgi:hypothetical protein